MVCQILGSCVWRVGGSINHNGIKGDKHSYEIIDGIDRREQKTDFPLVDMPLNEKTPINIKFKGVLLSCA